MEELDTIYILLGNDPEHELREYFIGVYNNRLEALKEQEEREKTTGETFRVDEYSTTGRLLKVNVKAWEDNKK